MIRHIDLQVLRDSVLFESHLLPDIRNGKVFPALRDDRIDFYYSGGRLFSYTKDGFKTNTKYAAVFEGNDDYVLESQLQRLKPITTFSQKEHYERIKVNCHNYSGIESRGVSDICRTFGSILSDNPEKIIALDVEIGFSSSGRPVSPDEPENTDIEPGRRKKWDRIEKNSVFLLVFGYDSIQKSDYVDRLLGSSHLLDYYYYSCGLPKRTTPGKIWNKVKKIGK